MIEYVRFTECNEWEGETWHFYIPLISDLIPKLEQIKTILALPGFKEMCGDEFRLRADPISEKKVMAVVNEQSDDCDYMHKHNLVKDIKLPDTIDMTDMEALHDIFYKGDCWVRDMNAYP